MSEKKLQVELSIIIPVFNAGKYLKDCLKGIQKAVEYSKIDTEVIVVDNGSTDNSLGIAKEFSANKALVLKILECQKKGASAARNMGILEARGEYAWFIDADDEIAEEAISELIKKAKNTEADIVMMGAVRKYEDGHEDYLSAVNPESENYKSRFVRYGAGPWQFIFRREWWTGHNFRFKEGIIHEDMEMISSLILYTDKFACVDMPLYFYHQTPNSVLHKRSYDEHVYDIFPALEGLHKRFKALRAQNTYHDELEWFFIWNLLIDSAKDFAKFPEARDGFKRSREMLKRYFPNWRKNKFLKQKPLKLKIRVRINYHRK